MKWLMGILGIGALGEVAGATYLFQKTIKRYGRMDLSKIPNAISDAWKEYIPIIKSEKEWLYAQKLEKMSIQTTDGLRLSGIWLEAPQESKKVIIALHGYRSKGESDFAAISHFYHDQGYHVLIVDHRAHGKSEGDYIGFAALEHKDSKKWIDIAVKKLGEEAHIYLHGISMGGATALALSSEKLPRQVKGIISDCGFTSAWEVFEHILRDDYHLPPFPILQIASSICKKQAGYTFDEVNNTERVKKSNLPILFIHGDQDTFVPTWMSRKMYAECQAEKKLVIISEAGHGESYYRDTETYQKAVKAFLSHCEKKSRVEKEINK